MNASVNLGATLQEDSRGEFLVWAPMADTVDVEMVAPRERRLALAKEERGYFHGIFEGVESGTLYFFVIDGNRRRPDPASRFQPQGVHGPSQVIDPRFPWEDRSWSGPYLRDYVIYELHAGAFTPEGTFDAVACHLDELEQLGITAVELMPAGQFPGGRNWGYDGTYPFAVQNTYGGPDGLKRLVNACHRKGLAVVLDVVYNHLGPEGNYLGDFGPYFTGRYSTPGAGPSISTDPTATKSGVILSKTLSIGSENATSMLCGSMPFMPSSISLLTLSWQSWRRQSIRKPSGSIGIYI